jgi:flagellar biosynthesis/type III secretory pathway M-ring protein FliF/YscJ
MEYLLDIIKIVVPALLVFLTSWILLRNMIRNDQEKRRQEVVLQGARTVMKG